MNRPFVSVVVITKDRHDLLLKAIASLKQSDYPADKFSIIVVEEGDAPAPPEGVVYCFLPRKDLGLGYARNTGVRNRDPRSTLVAFTDDDCLVEPSWLRKLTEVFDDPAVAGAAGSTFAQPGSRIGCCEDVLGYPGGGHKRYHAAGGRIQKTHLLSGCNCIYRAALLESIGFKEDGFGRLGADDYLLGITVAQNHTCLYVPDAVVYHKPRASFSKIIQWFSRRRMNELLIEQSRRNGKKWDYLLRTPREFGLLRVLLPALFLILFGGGGLLFLGTAWYAFMLWRSRAIARYFPDRAVAFLVPVVKFFMDIGIMAGEWKYLFGGMRNIDDTLKEYQR